MTSAPALSRARLTVVFSLREMSEVFGLCVRIRDASRELLDHADEMSLIALNASVSAANAEAGREVFGVLAREAQLIAAGMGEQVELVQAQAEVLAQRALRGVERARIAATLRLGRSRVRDAGNQARVGEALARVDETLGETVVHTRTTFDTIEQLLADFDRQNNRLMAIALNYRIETSRLPEGTTLSGFAAGMSELCARAAKTSRALAAMLVEAARFQAAVRR